MYLESPASAMRGMSPTALPRPERPEFEMGHVHGREVVTRLGRGRVSVPIGPVDRPVGPILIGGIVHGRLPQRS